ncbi:hypothetical protein [Kineococcus sp. SYSU DK004]|uniref:hypothetical protein n=1 Tax=Kineococcus sp. SYSU DK004 TaxID=3383125 RepID=UPI003D7F11BE
MVSMVVAGLVLAGVSAVTINQVRAVDAAEKRNAATLQTAGALDQVAKQLRTATALGSPPRAFITASAEEVGFYANVFSLDQSTAAGKRAAQRPQEVWLWTRTSGNRRQLCGQVRPLSWTAAGDPVLPSTPSLATASARTCRVLVDDLAAADAVPTFTYLRATDQLGTSGTSVSTIASASGAVTDTTAVQAVEVRLRAKADTSRGSNVVTSVARVTLLSQS